MLQKVVIEHFRSCENVTIDDIGPTLVLVGPNGSGKTNILKAILWAARSALSKEGLPALATDLEARSVSLDLRKDDDLLRYALSADPELRHPDSVSRYLALTLKESISLLEPDGTWEEIVSRVGPEIRLPKRSSLTVPQWTPFLPLLFAYLPADDPLLGPLRIVRDFLGRIRYYPFDEPSESQEPDGFIATTMYERWMAQRDESGRAEDDSVLMKILHMWKDAREDFKEVGAILGPNGLGLIDSIEVEAHEVPGAGGPGIRGEVYALYFHPPREDDGIGRSGNGAPRRFPYSDLSHGTRRVIRMIVSMIFDKGSVMLIEHPEDGIHRRLTASVFDTLQAYTDPTQILVSSHSSLVFNMLDPDEIRVVSMRDAKTEVRALTPDEAARARRYVKERGTLTEYLDLMIEA